MSKWYSAIPIWFSEIFVLALTSADFRGLLQQIHDGVEITDSMICEGAVIKEGAIVESGCIVGFKVWLKGYHVAFYLRSACMRRRGGRSEKSSRFSAGGYWRGPHSGGVQEGLFVPAAANTGKSER